MRSGTNGNDQSLIAGCLKPTTPGFCRPASNGSIELVLICFGLTGLTKMCNVASPNFQVGHSTT